MKAHKLYKQVGRGSALVAISSGALSTTMTGAGWEYVQIMPNGQTYQAFVNRQYIDLAGWSAQDLTMFTSGVDIQKDGLPISTVLDNPLMNVYDFITTRKITDAEIISTIDCAPSFLTSTLDLMQCVYGMRQTLAENSNIPGTYVNVDGGTFGSGNPTAMDRLHWTRLIITTMSSDEDDTGTWTVPATNLIVQAVTEEESDLVYIERLRRSYELQEEL